MSDSRTEALEAVAEAARDLYDNRLGWSDGRNPYAHPEFWATVGDALSRLAAAQGEPAEDAPKRCPTCHGLDPARPGRVEDPSGLTWERPCPDTWHDAPPEPGYPNKRDCEHGRQRGKCESCELAEVEAERDALRGLLRSGEWRRERDEVLGTERTYLAVRVADGADLSCPATRDAAIDAALEKHDG